MTAGPLPQPPHQPQQPQQVWTAWLDDLVRTADRLERQLAAGELLDLPDLAPPPVDEATPGLPGELLPRAAAVLDRLERLERLATVQRDHVAGQLHALAGRRPRPTEVAGYELGSAFDIAG